MTAIIQTIGNVVTQAQTMAQPTKKAKGEEFDIYLKAKIMGWAVVRKAKHMPRIWVKVTQSKNWMTHRDNIVDSMEKWAMANDPKIDQNFLVLKEVVEDWIKGLFNPGGYVATYVTAG